MKNQRNLVFKLNRRIIDKFNCYAWDKVELPNVETLIVTCDEREKLRYHRGYEKLSDMVVNLVYLDRHTRSSPIVHPRIRAGIPGDFVRRGRSYQRAPASSNLRKGKESPLSRPFFLLPLRPETRTISSNICHSLRVTTSLHLS